MILPTQNKRPFYESDAINLQVATHALIGKIVSRTLASYSAPQYQTDYHDHVYDLIKSYISEEPVSVIQHNLEVARQALVDFVNEFPKAVEFEEYVLNGEINLRQALLFAVSFSHYQAKNDMKKMSKRLLVAMRIDDDYSYYDCFIIDDYIRTIYDGVNNCMQFRYDHPSQTVPARSKTWVVKESHLCGGNPESDRSIQTQLNFRAKKFNPANPRKFYKEKFNDFLNTCFDITLMPDDITAIHWCVKDWMGLARHYIETDQPKKGLDILEALLSEYYEAFNEPSFLEGLFVLDSEYERELTSDLAQAQKIYIDNLDCYSPEESKLALEQFKEFEKVYQEGELVDIYAIIDALSSKSGDFKYSLF